MKVQAWHLDSALSALFAAGSAWQIWVASEQNAEAVASGSLVASRRRSRFHGSSLVASEHHNCDDAQAAGGSRHSCDCHERGVRRLRITKSAVNPSNHRRLPGVFRKRCHNLHRALSPSWVWPTRSCDAQSPSSIFRGEDRASLAPSNSSQGSPPERIRSTSPRCPRATH